MFPYNLYGKKIKKYIWNIYNIYGRNIKQRIEIRSHKFVAERKSAEGLHNFHNFYDT